MNLLTYLNILNECVAHKCISCCFIVAKTAVTVLHGVIISDFNCFAALSLKVENVNVCYS